jgi:hypothetical protein
MVDAMAKYDLLHHHLRRQRLEEFEMTFAEIERRIGAMLPNGAQRPQWWANVTAPGTTDVQRKAWINAGFDAFLILGCDRVRFRRKSSSMPA